MNDISETVETVLAESQQAADQEKPKPWRPSDEQTEWMLRQFENRGYRTDVDNAACRKLAAWAVAHVKGKAGKGLIMYGGMGLGKTMFGERVLTCICPAWNGVFTAVDIARLYTALDAEKFNAEVHGEYKGENLHVFGREIMLDDLGREPLTVHFGQREDVLGNVICDRYRLWKNHSIKTFITCNISERDIESRYDERVIDRIREMCYPVHFQGESARAQ